MNEELNSYVKELNDEAKIILAEYGNDPKLAFTAAVIQKIESLFDCKEITIEKCTLYSKNGNNLGEIHAYTESTNGEVLYLFYTDYCSEQYATTKNNTEATVGLNRLQAFYNASIRCVYADLDSSTTEYRAAKYIYDNVQKFQSVKLIILSNYIINNLSLQKIRIVSKPVFCDVWCMLPRKSDSL